MDENIDLKSIFRKNDTADNFIECELNAEHILGRAVLLMGGSESGKTYMMRHILHVIKNHTPRVVLFSSTADLTHDFRGIINPVMSISHLTSEKFLEVMNAQMELAWFHNKVINNYNNLKRIISSLCSQTHINAINVMETHLTNKILEIENSEGLEGIIKEKVQNLKDEYEENTILFMKTILMPLRNQDSYDKLDDKFKKILMYLDLNKETVIIFDDMQEEIKRLVSKKSSEETAMFNNVFTKGRHYGITFLFALQGDKQVEPLIRSNARLCIFTAATEATNYIQYKNNGIDKESQNYGLELIRNIFQGPDDYRKLIYFKDNKPMEKFQYLKAENHGIFPVGSKFINEFCNNIYDDGSIY